MSVVSMDLDERFKQLTPGRQLAVAAASARRVLPIFVAMGGEDPTPLRDGIDIVELAARGQAFSQVEYTRAINDITAVASAELDSPEHTVCTAIIAALEAAAHNPSAALDSLSAARRAVALFAGHGADHDEALWQRWAASHAANSIAGAPIFSAGDAPPTSWQAKLQDDLPLFEQKRDA